METNDAASIFGALAQPTRVEIFQRLVKQGPDGVSAGDLAAELAVPAPTLSFHLKELAANGLILSRKEGRSVIYAANYGGIRGLVEFLLADCCQGDPRLCGPYIIKECA